MEVDQNIIYDELKSKLQLLENALIDLKDDPTDLETINEIFRAIHTIKATADLLFIFDIVTLVSSAEDVLTEVRNGKLKVDEDFVSLFFEFKEYLSIVLFNILSGIFDDEVTQRLFIHFQQEFKLLLDKQYIHTKTILVIDESALVRYAIKKVAIDNGYKVMMSDNLIRGKQKLQQYHIDLVFCDIMSKDVETKSSISTIRAGESCKNLKVVLLTDKLDTNLKHYAQDVMANAWIKKPLDLDKVKLILNKLLG